MPGHKVVDASARAALVFNEPRAIDMANALSDSQLVAPPLLWFEISSVCLKKIQRHPELRSALLSAFEDAGRLTIQIVDVDQVQVVKLAEAEDLTTYDASYLWLADEIGAELVTLDKRLHQAARSPADHKPSNPP